MLFPIFPTFPDPYPTHEAQGFKKIIHHLEAMPVDSQEKKKKARLTIGYDSTFAIFHPKFWKLILLFQVNFSSLRFQGRVWQVVLIHLLRAGESKMPTHQILVGSPNPKKLEDWMVLTQFHITIGFQKPATCRSVPLHPREGPCCFWEMTHIRCTPRTLHSSPSTGDSNDVSDLLQNSIASKRSRKKSFTLKCTRGASKTKMCLEIWTSSICMQILSKTHQNVTQKITSSIEHIRRHFNQFYRLAMIALRGDGHSIVSLVAEVLVRFRGVMKQLLFFGMSYRRAIWWHGLCGGVGVEECI